MAKFYKYRSLENLKRFLEIVMNRKLWSSTYKELNDPMKGVFSIRPWVQRLKFYTYVTKLKTAYIYLCPI